MDMTHSSKSTHPPESQETLTPLGSSICCTDKKTRPVALNDLQSGNQRHTTVSNPCVLKSKAAYET